MDDPKYVLRTRIFLKPLSQRSLVFPTNYKPPPGHWMMRDLLACRPEMGVCAVKAIDASDAKQIFDYPLGITGGHHRIALE